MRVSADTQMHPGAGPEINYMGLVGNRIWAGKNVNSNAERDSRLGSPPQALPTLWPGFHHHACAGWLGKGLPEAMQLCHPFSPASLGTERGDSYIRQRLPKRKLGFHNSFPENSQRWEHSVSRSDREGSASVATVITMSIKGPLSAECCNRNRTANVYWV